LRLVAAVGVVGWLGTLSYASRMVETSSRVLFGGGWLVLLAAVATSFAAQSQVASAVERAKGVADGSWDDRDASWSSAPGTIALCLVVVGLALVGLAILL
jgi:hypothetical protein